MAHAAGWIEAYGLLEEGKAVPHELKAVVCNNRNEMGETMLHWYAIEGEVHVVEKLILMGFDVNTQNEFLTTPLFECTMMKRWDMVTLLLKHGADTMIKNQIDETVWEWHSSQSDVLQKLESLVNEHGKVIPWKKT